MKTSRRQLSSAAATILLIALGSLFPFSRSSAGQQPRGAQAAPSPTPPPETGDVIKVKTNLVQVDAVVTNDRGQQVTDLTASDFEIIEEGRKRTPEYCSYIVSAAATKAEDRSVGPPTADQLGRVFVFLVSNPIIEFGYSFSGANGGAPRSGTSSTQAVAVRAAEKTRTLLNWFVDSQMTQGDLAAIADTDVDIGVLSSFTNDRDVLHAAINHVRDNAVSGRSPVIRITVVNADASLKPLVKRNFDALQMLENVIGQVVQLPGRKVVVFIARGILFNPDLPYAPAIKERLDRVITKANQARIAVYTLHTRDLNPQGGNIGNDGLIHLARETGGRPIYNTNDLRAGFDSVIEENRGYYLLAYNPGAEAEGRPHRLKVKVNRPGLNVLARSEAFAPTRFQSDSGLHPLESPLTAKEIGVTVTPTIIKAGLTSRVDMSWRIDLAQAETESTDQAVQRFSLMLSVRVTGPNGKILKHTDQDSSFEVKDADLERARHEGVVSKFHFEANEPGFYRIAVAVVDKNSGKLGRTTRFVRIE